jgi:hypothetical protein
MTTITTPLGSVEQIPFPNRIVEIGDSDSATVKRVQQRLNAVGCGPIAEDGVFDDDTEDAVKLFQRRFTDVTGNPLVVDGQIGSLTWGALFGKESVPSNSTASSALTRSVIDFAETQIGVRENPLGSNRGTKVDEYLSSVGLDPTADSYPWCVAFTYFCYKKAAAELSIPNPHVKTAGVLDHWRKAKAKQGVLCVTNSQAVANPSLVKPGALFIMSRGSGRGHTGIVIEVAHGRLVTIEGNTNDGGAGEGIGVFKRTARKIVEIDKGFIDYSAF